MTRRRDKGAALASLIVLAAVTAAAILAPTLSPADPVKNDLLERLTPPMWNAGGSAAHPLGTDTLGVVLKATAGSNVEVTQTLTFHRGSYLVDVAYEVANRGNAPLAADAYYQIVRDNKPPEGQHSMVPAYTGAAVYNEQNKFTGDNYKAALQDFIQVVIGWFETNQFDPELVEFAFGADSGEPAMR